MSEIFAWITGIVALIIPGFGEDPGHQYHGYMEANYVYVAPASAGRISAIEAIEGAVVEQGEVLFLLEDDQLQAGLRAAIAREAVAEAMRRNLETGGREQEIAVIRASLTKAETDRELARVTLQRTERLSEQGLVPLARLDTDRARLASAQAQVAQLKAQLEVAELPAREAKIVAAEASLTAARADVDRAKSDLDERVVLAPISGLVERIFFRAGEVAAIGTPVIALLPPSDLKARFFIPEGDRMRFELGDELELTCDGCPLGTVATLSYMSSDPQHTPPIIYSRDERARLVFMAEARLSGDLHLLPGQPVTLTEAIDPDLSEPSNHE